MGIGQLDVAIRAGAVGTILLLAWLLLGAGRRVGGSAGRRVGLSAALCFDRRFGVRGGVLGVGLACVAIAAMDRGLLGDALAGKGLSLLLRANRRLVVSTPRLRGMEVGA